MALQPSSHPFDPNVHHKSRTRSPHPPRPRSLLLQLHRGADGSLSVPAAGAAPFPSQHPDAGRRALEERLSWRSEGNTWLEVRWGGEGAGWSVWLQLCDEGPVWHAPGLECGSEGGNHELA